MSKYKSHPSKASLSQAGANDYGDGGGRRVSVALRQLGGWYLLPGSTVPLAPRQTSGSCEAVGNRRLGVKLVQDCLSAALPLQSTKRGGM